MAPVTRRNSERPYCPVNGMMAKCWFRNCFKAGVAHPSTSQLNASGLTQRFTVGTVVTVGKGRCQFFGQVVDYLLIAGGPVYFLESFANVESEARWLFERACHIQPFRVLKRKWFANAGHRASYYAALDCHRFRTSANYELTKVK